MISVYMWNCYTQSFVNKKLFLGLDIYKNLLRLRRETGFMSR